MNHNQLRGLNIVLGGIGGTFLLLLILLAPVGSTSAQMGYPAGVDPLVTPTKPPTVTFSKRLYLAALASPGNTVAPGPTPTAPPSPATTILSRYVSSVSTQTMGDLGKRRGGCLGTGPGTTKPTDGKGFMILSMGAPYRSGSNYGVVLYDYTTIRTALIADIELGVKAFLDGYFTCVPAAQRSTARMVVGVGVNNSYAFTVSGSRQYFVDTEHGRQWGLMINRLNDYIGSQAGMSTLLQVVGAADLEPDFGSRLDARNWVDGYNASSQSAYYNYGTCDACPEGAGTPLPGTRVGSDQTGGSLDFGWRVDDVWYVSYGARLAWPLPEIYVGPPSAISTPRNAIQWQRISLYGATCVNLCEPATAGRRAKLYFPGVMVQNQACLDQPGTCSSTEINTPTQGWQQLWQQLNSDRQTTQSALPWLTDISWTK